MKELENRKHSATAAHPKATGEIPSTTENSSTQSSDMAIGSMRATDDADQPCHTIEGNNQEQRTVGDVVSLIQDIADQNNLLALKAIFEAAQDGEAGKGFASVTNEAKLLSNLAGRKTDEIAKQGDGMQNVPGSSVKPDDNQANIVGDNSEDTYSTPTTTDEHISPAQGISRCVQQAESEIEYTPSQVSALTDGLSEKSSLLRTEVQRFTKNLRAA